MPKPKVNSEFVAWGEYLGTGKDEAFVAWKKRQIGEADPTYKTKADVRQPTDATPKDKDKENKQQSRSSSVWKKNVKGT